MKKIFVLTVFVLGSLISFSQDLLVFSHTQGFRHSSIEVGQKALKKLGEENGFKITATEDPEYFTEDKLKDFSAVIFLNTTQDILNEDQQNAFKKYIQGGKGFVGIHAAADTEYDWPWYNKLVGAYFKSHPEIQEATLNVIDRSHISTSMLPSKWVRSDEWYNFKSMNPDVHVLITIDESSYEGGENGDYHPMAWYHEYEGGKAFYTALGHTEESYSDPLFLQHVLGGIKYVLDK